MDEEDGDGPALQTSDDDGILDVVALHGGGVEVRGGCRQEGHHNAGEDHKARRAKIGVCKIDIDEERSPHWGEVAKKHFCDNYLLEYWDVMKFSSHHLSLSVLPVNLRE